MYRITDPARSRGFYEALSLEFRRELPIVRNGELEATTYELGTGYGHIALAVDDLDGTLARLSEEAIKPEREPYRVREGGSRLCFVRDADEFDVKPQLAQRAFVCSSEKEAAFLAENYVGLEHA